jgi:hypothetical protein
MLRSLCHRRRRKVPEGPGLDPERFRVFALACARRVWDYLTPTLRVVLEHLERCSPDDEPDLLQHAWDIRRYEAERLQGQATLVVAEYFAGAADMRRMAEIHVQLAAGQVLAFAAMIKPYHAAQHHTWAARARGIQECLDEQPPGRRLSHLPRFWDRTSASELRAQAAVLRDVFGNPYRPVTFEAHWRTPSAVALAQEIRDGRDYSLMPILADALQDAGCDDPGVLSHCREEPLHVRGCFVADHVLGLW